MGNCIAPTQQPRTRESEKQIILALWPTEGADVRDWNVISAKWWASWRLYTGFDDEEAGGLKVEEPIGQEDADSEVDLPPQPDVINNDDLASSVEGELRRGMTEFYDYELLPQPIYEQLQAWYGGGPSFQRRVVNPLQQEPYVELYPIRFEVYRFASRRNDASEASQPHQGSESWLAILHFHSDESMDRVQGGILRRLNFEVRSPLVRLWIRAGGESASGMSAKESDPIEMQDPALRGGSSSGSAEDADSWTPLTDADLDLRRVTVHEFLEEVQVAKILVETRTSPDEPFPRDMISNGWRSALGVGALLDALDSDKRWFESQVVDVEEDRVKIHYLGWSSKWDAWVPRGSPDLLPLHSRTTMWRQELGKGDDIEVADRVVSDTKTHRWHFGTIIKVGKLSPPNKLSSRKVIIRISDALETPWVDMGSELVCQVGTHTKNRRNENQRMNRNNAYIWGRASVTGEPVASGAVGLINLGNTCFMNSMLQCVAQTPLLTPFFLEGKFKGDLNRRNALGTGGKLTEAYSELLKKIWSSSYSTLAPKEFKAVLGKHAPQFAGYQQHDSQEFMSFLMDGIHEDLNRVKKKPYTEVVEGGDGKPDEEVANEAWRRHLLRNDSVIVDHCEGLLRSHLVCPKCKHESVTFDPYMSLSLPLPTASRRAARNTVLSVTFVPLPSKGGKLRPMDLTVPSRGTVRDLTLAVARELVGPEATEDAVAEQAARCRVCDIWQHKVHKILKLRSPLVEIRATDVTVVYEVEHLPAAANRSSVLQSPTNSASPHTTIRYCDVVHTKTSHSSPGRSRVGADVPVAFGAPWHFSYDVERSTCADVRKTVMAYLDSLMAQGHAQDMCSVVEFGSQADLSLRVLPNDPRVPFHAWFSSRSTRALRVVWRQNALSHLRDEAPKDFQVTSRRGPGAGSVSQGDSIDLMSCFKLFTEREQLGENDLWYCSKCKDHVAAFKKFDLWTAPDVLILHLKRFEYIPGYHFVHRQKIESMVDFPVKGLDVSDLIKGPVSNAQPVYDLYAVSEHHGSLGVGHYTAVVKNLKDGNWYRCNDSNVGVSAPQAGVTRQAYVLFYARRGGSSRWAGMSKRKAQK
uniref:Ubiquitinyl hydrolase 1 n=1 Tax=Rhizochromulina marina TaxID=1034831 RepID=A0A7S2W2S4_9STRA|mmetsp:Transcript_13239/g.38481  ORF Transcript_13239/g.38481 Transcript_13239/m.38481 type:complete len:1088 (+) Transcript_13239:215-3478(+)|eukprot:CAMPEP_0118962638 /NCGR_PEP_ID=MMETSP1173-20130426/900_1 /TAXON_ID=1034831 /ORGANISM="Rhizochromulina marina cf, Strain CCMP1243" /LENGTH=1087 /DNA_ID=CAMNT_0006910923 /DNA_START=110 /DNA_END=3373 /DNA_ORIENTATION=-